MIHRHKKKQNNREPGFVLKQNIRHRIISSLIYHLFITVYASHQLFHYPLIIQKISPLSERKIHSV